MKDLNFNVLKKRSGCDTNFSLYRLIYYLFQFHLLWCVFCTVICNCGVRGGLMNKESAFKRLVYDPTCFIDAKHGLLHIIESLRLM